MASDARVALRLFVRDAEIHFVQGVRSDFVFHTSNYLNRYRPLRYAMLMLYQWTTAQNALFG